MHTPRKHFDKIHRLQVKVKVESNYYSKTLINKKKEDV